MAKKPAGRPPKEGNNKESNSSEPKEEKSKEEKAKWSTLGEQNLMYTVNEKGFLFLRVDLNKVYKPSKSFYNEGSKKKTNILVSSTGGNKKMLNGNFSELAISVNIYRPMSESEIEEWSGK